MSIKELNDMPLEELEILHKEKGYRFFDLRWKDPVV